MDICVLREMIEKKEISDINWADSASQLADCLTKLGASSAKLLDVLSGDMDDYYLLF